MKQSSSQKVSLGEKLGYSLGDAAANLVFQMMMIFQLKFYTDVFGLDGAIAGSVLMIASISAIIVDPAIGHKPAAASGDIQRAELRLLRHT